VGDEDDDDNLEDILWALGPEILQKSPKGLENLERVIKASKETMYGVEKSCLTHWTLLCFVLELLILKAKYGWSDCSFNDLLHLLSWLLPQPNSVPANTYQMKKVISPLTMGVEKSMHVPTIVSFFRGKTFKSLDKCPRCGASRYKNNDFYSGDETSTRNKRNKKGTKKAVQES
jgi:phage FluMu protein Com